MEKKLQINLIILISLINLNNPQCPNSQLDILPLDHWDLIRAIRN